MQVLEHHFRWIISLYMLATGLATGMTGCYANAVDGAKWIAHSQQVGQHTGSGRGLHLLSSNGFEFGPT